MELCHKSRGPRVAEPLTAQGHEFLPRALHYLEPARALTERIPSSAGFEEILIAASQYLILYVLIDAVRRFHRAFPSIRVRLSNYTEEEIEDRLLHDPDIAFGPAAPYEMPAEHEYRNLTPCYASA